jgi:DNA repair exonuclease SbcCD ATPase subunit
MSASSSTKRKPSNSSSHGDSKSVTTVNPQLELAKSIKALVASQDMSHKRIQQLDELMKSITGDFELQITTKKRELEQLNEDYNHRQKTRHLQLEHEFKELEMTKVKEILESRNEMSITKQEHSNLQNQIKELHKAHEDETAQIRASLHHMHEKELKELEKTKRLEVSAQLAEFNAAKTSHTQQIALLHSTIESLRNELMEQRNLTKSVAESSRPQHYQNYERERGVAQGR